MATRPKTFGALKKAGYRHLPVKHEIRKNLIARLAANSSMFPGIVGYDDTVLPQLTNALLSTQDLILLGERGQAKSRIVRSLVTLLDEEIPVLAGLEIPESPFAPVTSAGRELLAEKGNSAPLAWLSRDERFAEKLATPDITIADLLGEVDPIKVAQGRYLSDESSIHFGLIPRANLGIFAINELPDLTERIQVGMLNILEERDVQIRGFKVRLPLDVFLIVTANPEDYTNRGRIITPLKDRFGSQIKTHYPRTISEEIQIMEQEAHVLPMAGYEVAVPRFLKEIVAAITHEARQSPDVNQRSGVSVRTSISIYETLIANAFRRALRLDERNVVPRISDIPFVLPSLQGKVEFEVFEQGDEEKVTAKLCKNAIRSVFDRHFEASDLEPIVLAFEDGRTLEVGEDCPESTYRDALTTLGESFGTVANTVDNPAELPSYLEFILEGLHLHDMLSKYETESGSSFQI